ncbi:uncharacterized protein LOC141691365 [Apium graveolens]|uniref:uncharacterized protein LOC141691365 n=1 Tax=Apium graveolens TaxID=4045 RepID=UPI003D79ACB2
MAESSNTSSAGNDNTNPQFNQDNPLHLQSSDNPGLKLVSDQFDGTGFSSWKRSMTIALSARNKIGFIDGSIPKPNFDSPMFKSWSRCNDMVISWILGALSKSIGRSVIYSSSVREIWMELEERYCVSNGAQLFGLHKELTDISQVCKCGCTCGASHKISKFQEDQRVIQFLMGLNDSFNIMRGSILMKSPLPSVGQVYSLLLQEETQRKIHSTSHFMAGYASLNVNSSSSYPSGQLGNTAPYNSFSKKPGNDTRKLHCNYWKKPGHLIEKCYKLHGFPADFKFNKPNKIVAQAELSDQIENTAINSNNGTQAASSSQLNN